MAEEKIIENIVNEFLDHEYPEEIQLEFQEWILNSQNRKEKDDALMKYATGLNPEFDHQLFSEKLQKVNETIDRKKNRYNKRLFIQISSIAAASLVLIVSTYLLTVKYAAVANNEVFITSSHSKGEFQLPDGSKVILNASSRLEVPADFSDNNRHVHLDGEGYFNIKKDPDHAFNIASEHVDIKVVGTIFNMKSYSSSEYAEVVLERGLVEVTGKSIFKPIRMVPGERLVIDKSVELNEVYVPNYTSWTGKQLLIDNLPLKDILVNLEHWYNVEFEVTGKFDPSPRLTFVVYNESLDNVLEQIAMLTPFKYKISNNVVYYHSE
ncbi:FecR family protein [Mangrovibacterium diazotrophicum]|uniref:FecR family protein n=1 Tax=Mangrovibacterium diazotrophicum TaxID=1261403 RepID=A0A419W623_9BACT|nr:FecR family protein [Mangrovibacterium diazotrophicum]RKD90897.1 FecR family protein [Mangrovibacterium diazotrophicum]